MENNAEGKTLLAIVDFGVMTSLEVNVDNSKDALTLCATMAKLFYSHPNMAESIMELCDFLKKYPEVAERMSAGEVNSFDFNDILKNIDKNKENKE